MKVLELRNSRSYGKRFGYMELNKMKRHVIFLIVSLPFLGGCWGSNIVKSTPDSTLAPRASLLQPSPPTLAVMTPLVATLTVSETVEAVFRVEDMFAKNAEQFVLVETVKPSSQPWESLANSTGEYRASHLCEPPCGVFIEEISSGKIYELSMPDLNKNRGVKDLSWSSAYILEFTQGTSPNIALRYVVDIREQKILDIVHYFTP